MYRAFLVTVLCSLAFVSCGYRAVSAVSGADGEQVAISVPLIETDNEGILRNQLAEQLSASGKYCYSSSTNTRYQLIVKNKSDATEQIGYLWDVNPKTGERFTLLYPNEGRRLSTFEVSVYDTHKKKTVVPAFRVSSHVDFDFVNPTDPKDIVFTDLQGQKQTVLQYSYGQVDSEEGAKLESYQPLYQHLAKQIIMNLLRKNISD